MKYASTIIDDGVERVVTVLPLNAVSGFNQNSPPPYTYGCPDNVEIGWLRIGGVFVVPPDPVPTVPESITPRQGYIILSRYGLLAPVQAYFGALTGQPGEEARIELEYAQEWRRDWPTLNAAAAAFGLTESQIDQMFMEAALL